MAFLRDIGWPWVALWFLVYVAFLVLDFLYDDVIAITILKYGSLVICLFYVLIHSKNDYFLILALCLTLIADGFLVADNSSIIGVAVFLSVQVAHLLRLSRIRNVSPLVFLALAAIILALGLFQKAVPPMFALAATYGFLIGVNIYQAARWQFRDHSLQSRACLIGLILFFLCDVCVAIAYLTSQNSIEVAIYATASYLSWLFYCPAQIALSLSGRTASLRRH